jgi:DNA repair protein RadD
VDILRLLDDGHLCPIRTKAHPTEQIDISQLKTIRGEFETMGMEKAFTEPTKFNAYMSHMASIYQSGQRNKFLIFGVSRAHCKLMQKAFEAIGIPALYCDGDTPKKERNAIVEKFRAAKRSVLINCALYTTGFNVRDVDCLAMVRATQSPVLYIQVLGRIMRTHPSKEDGLVLDYGKNIERFGPINLIKVAPKHKGAKEKNKTATVKICSSCGEYNALSNKECAECKAPFPVQDRTTNVTRKASEADIIQRAPLTYAVTDTRYLPCKSAKGIEMLKIQYYCGLKTFAEYLLLEHPEHTRKHARAKWLSLGGKSPAPASVKQAWERKDELLKPSRITVKRDGNFHNVIARSYTESQELRG